MTVLTSPWATLDFVIWIIACIPLIAASIYRYQPRTFTCICTCLQRGYRILPDQKIHQHISLPALFQPVQPNDNATAIAVVNISATQVGNDHGSSSPLRTAPVPLLLPTLPQPQPHPPKLVTISIEPASSSSLSSSASTNKHFVMNEIQHIFPLPKHLPPIESTVPAAAVAALTPRLFVFNNKLNSQ